MWSHAGIRVGLVFFFPLSSDKVFLFRLLIYFPRAWTYEGLTVGIGFDNCGDQSILSITDFGFRESGVGLHHDLRRDLSHVPTQTSCLFIRTPLNCIVNSVPSNQSFSCQFSKVSIPNIVGHRAWWYPPWLHEFAPHSPFFYKLVNITKYDKSAAFLIAVKIHSLAEASQDRNSDIQSLYRELRPYIASLKGGEQIHAAKGVI